MKIQVQVLQKHWRKGIRNSCWACPIAQAVRDTMEARGFRVHPNDGVAVCLLDTEITDRDGNRWMAKNSQKVIDMIQAFDDAKGIDGTLFPPTCLTFDFEQKGPRPPLRTAGAKELTDE